MSKIQLARHAIRLWPGHKHNQRAWLRSVLMLGDRWLLAVPVSRRAQT